AVGKGSRQGRIGPTADGAHLFRLLAGIVVIVKFDRRRGTHLLAGLGVRVEIVRDGGVADGPEVAIGQAHADGADGLVTLIAPIVAAIDEVAIGEIALRRAPEDALENVAA